MNRRAFSAVVAAVTLAGLLSSPSARSGDSAWKTWMKQNVVPAKTAGDFDALAVALAKIGTANPDAKAFPKWRSIADEGVAAAKKHDKDGVNASCSGCHKAYRKLFHDQYQSAPTPK